MKTFIGCVIAIILIGIGSFIYYHTDLVRQETSDQKFNVAVAQNNTSLQG